MEGLKFYRCNECGNLFLVLVDPSVIPTCCSHGMAELRAHQVSGEDVEEVDHTPIIEIVNDKAIVRIGSKSHPMMAEHRIEWIALQNGMRVDIQKLKLTEDPVADFTIRDKSERLQAYAFCNLHGLWGISK